MSQRVDVLALGELRVINESGAAIDVHGKLASLLVLVAVERDVPRQRALAMLWDGVPEESARHALRQALLRLKQAVGAEMLHTERENVQAVEQLTSDLLAFEAAIKAERYAEAVNLYRGDFLAGFDTRSVDFEQWRGRRAAGAAVQLRTAVRQLVADSVHGDRLDEALRWARRWAQVSPEDDEAQHRVIELLGALGRRSEAIEHYDRYRTELLRDQLEPLEETASLVTQIRNGVALGALTTMSRGAIRPVVRTRRFGGRTGGGPRLVRIVEGGVEAESHYLNPGVNLIGRANGHINIPFDAGIVEDHASIEVQHSNEGFPGVRLRAHNGPVFLRIHGEWPLRHGDCFRLGQQQFSLDMPATQQHP